MYILRNGGNSTQDYYYERGKKNGEDVMQPIR